LQEVAEVVDLTIQVHLDQHQELLEEQVAVEQVVQRDQVLLHKQDQEQLTQAVVEEQEDLIL
jgi:hypothetical protein